MRLTVRKDLHVTGPEFLAAPDPHAALRNGARYATDGIGPDLMTAARDALRRMIEWLGREHGLDADRAYLLCSVAVDLRISEIVDMPNFVVTAHCPLHLRLTTDRWPARRGASVLEGGPLVGLSPPYTSPTRSRAPSLRARSTK